MVDRHGYGGQQKRTICGACGQRQSTRSIMKPVVLMDSLCLRVDQVPRSPDLELFVLMVITQPITLACIHKRANNRFSYGS
jgi:hypothetical protein